MEPNHAAQNLGLDGERAPVVVRELETLAPKPGSEHTVLLSQVVNHILLLAVDPARTSSRSCTWYVIIDLKITPSGQTIVKPTTLGPVANTELTLRLVKIFERPSGQQFAPFQREAA